ncbi:MAG TPA: penicillin acylase family protein, partial [Actinomycetota bacterium]|nr:penicillin acylase family protein [Actinomycetota bacterium]
MSIRKRRAAALAAALVLVGTITTQLSAAAAPGLGAKTDHGLFLNILPAGQGHSINLPQALAYEAAGSYPPNFTDQLEMYRSLPVEVNKVTDRTLSKYFKPETMKLDPRDVVSTEHPKAGLTIVRDRFGVPHIYGETRDDATWGTGYVTAEDRLFMADVLRHVGRGQLSAFLGATPDNLAMDRATYLAAGYSEAELQMMVDRYRLFGELGQQVYEDGVQFTAGMNARIEQDLANPSLLPAEYAALQLTPNRWKLTDGAAAAIVIQAQFAGGGGAELENAVVLARLQERFGANRGRKLFDDLLERNDPEAPTSIDTPFPYETGGRIDSSSVAIPDPATVRCLDPLTPIPPPTSSGTSTYSAPTCPAASSATNPMQAWNQALAKVGLAMPDSMSNWLGVTADRTASGHPITVMGPQVAYFSPEILMEMDVHAPGLHARGATFPGISLYVLLGRGPHYAWSATSGESDLVDVRAERLCEPDGSTPSVDSDSYEYRGKCVPIYQRTDTWLAKPSAGGIAPPTVVSAHVERTIHGPVFARGIVQGHPAAFASQRTTFLRELDSSGTFALANSGTMSTPNDFFDAFSLMTGSFNWLYVNDRQVAYFHSGTYPRRAPGVDPDLPVWGTGQWEWRGFVPGDLSGADVHPRAIDPPAGFFTNWNNKPAPRFRSADNQYGYGTIHRVQMLSKRLAPVVARGRVRPSDVVRAMADAATVDLRGQEVVPYLLRLIGSDRRLAPYTRLLRRWVASGAHRVDRDGNGQYDDSPAVALMDAWWDRVVRAAFDPTLGGLYDLIPLPFDDENRTDGLGSSFQGGYYGYLQKTARMLLGDHVAQPYRVLRCADGTLAGCRQAVRDSLAAAVAALGPDPSKWNANEAGD